MDNLKVFETGINHEWIFRDKKGDKKTTCVCEKLVKIDSQVLCAKQVCVEENGYALGIPFVIIVAMLLISPTITIRRARS